MKRKTGALLGKDTKDTKAGKGQTLSVRVSGEEHVAIQAASEKAEMTVSAFFRSLLLEGAGVRPILTPDDRLIMVALLEEMRAIGVNLNQVARALNSGGTVGAGDLDDRLKDVQRVQAAVVSELRQMSRRAGQARRGGA